jgi:hypothetical protein
MNLELYAYLWDQSADSKWIVVESATTKSSPMIFDKKNYVTLHIDDPELDTELAILMKKIVVRS